MVNISPLYTEAEAETQTSESCEYLNTRTEVGIESKSLQKRNTERKIRELVNITKIMELYLNAQPKQESNPERAHVTCYLFD